MFSVSISKIVHLYPNRAYLEFKVEGIESLNVPVPTLSFYIQRSESEQLTDPWLDLNPQGTESFYYIDTTPRLLSFYKSIYYRVYTKFDGKLYYSDPTNVTRHLRPDEIARRRKILYDEEVVLKKFTGRKLAILKRRHVGPRCCDCFDPNTRSVTKSHCRTCYGTGFMDPYYDPFIVYGARLPGYAEADELGSDSANERDYSKYQILDYPSVDPQDIMFDLEVNDRYKIDRVESTEMRRRTVHQELVVTKLSRTSIEYKYPIDNNLFELPASIEV